MIANKIIVLGSSNTDMVIHTDRLPDPGETVLGGEFMMTAGGKGANQAVAASRLGGTVSFISKIGDDYFGKKSISLYQKENINIDNVFIDNDRPSGIAQIIIDAKAENSIVVAPGANMALSKEDVDKSSELIKNASILLMQLEVPLETVNYAISIAKPSNTKVILNPAPACSLPEDIYSDLFLIIPNNTEAEILTGVEVTDWDSAKKAATILHNKGADNVIITLGSAGALVGEKGAFTEVPIEVAVEAVDTTAAGDTFCGAVAVALTEGMDMKQAVRFANRAAGLSVSRKGAQISIPYRKEVIL